MTLANVSYESWVDLEQRVKELEDVVALQSSLILELNRRIESGSAASEGTPVTKGKAAEPQ